MHMSQLPTRVILSLGIAVALLSILPSYAWVFDKNWPLTQNFPIGWLGACMGYMTVFFHEIGHTIFRWFYGYAALPSFDFQHGGGVAYHFGGQKVPILLMIWGALTYTFWLSKGYKLAQSLIALAFIVNISLAFTDYHAIIPIFMGPGFECLVGGFFLYRALFDLAPRGDFERFLNAFFGFGMIINVFVRGLGLLKNEVYRIIYLQQKGGHGAGDFDKIVDLINFLDFQDVIYLWLILNTICLILPFGLFIVHSIRDDNLLR